VSTIIVIGDDLIFRTKIDIIINSLNLSEEKYNYFNEIDFNSIEKQKVLFIIDLENEKLNFSIINKLKNKHKEKIVLLGYCAHVKSNLMVTALNSGFDKVMPRSKFVKFLPEFLKNFDKTNK
jgi:hypothetical protein